MIGVIWLIVVDGGTVWVVIIERGRGVFGKVMDISRGKRVRKSSEGKVLGWTVRLVVGHGEFKFVFWGWLIFFLLLVFKLNLEVFV